MQQLAKIFSIQLNQALDDAGLPIAIRERASALSKMLDIPKAQALSMLEGHLLPAENLLEQIAAELEVDVDWLQGKNLE